MSKIGISNIVCAFLLLNLCGLIELIVINLKSGKIYLEKGVVSFEFKKSKYFNSKLMRCLSEIESEIEGELKAIENNNFSIDMNLEKIMFSGTEEKTDIFSGKKNA